MIANRALGLATLALLSLVACSSSSSEVSDAKIGSTQSAVIKGKPSDTSQDAVVLLIHYDRNSPGVGSCTGTLIAPRLVLTARHCVGDTDETAACAADGTPIINGVIRGNHKAETMYVFTGKDRPDFRMGRVEPAGIGMKILDDGGKNLCNHDIALLVLKEPITDVPIAPIRLDGDVKKGELITSVGWGVTDKTVQPDVRQQRTNVKIVDVGPNEDEGNVPPNEFQVGESICSGDSGGPAIDQETQAVVGVVSRGGNHSGNNNPSDPAANCINGSNLYTKISPFKTFLMKGFALAEAEPWIEGGPDPRKAKAGESCSEADECRSALCLPDPDKDGANTCAEDCSTTEACTDEAKVCTEEGDAKVCRAPAPPPEEASAKSTTRVTSSSCSASNSKSTESSFALLGLALAGIAIARRSRRGSAPNR